tara:strand:+ start:1553 stop:1726 length:174 start_codon:yes stop_codon:yes gene_type:complete
MPGVQTRSIRQWIKAYKGCKIEAAERGDISNTDVTSGEIFTLGQTVFQQIESCLCPA